MQVIGAGRREFTILPLDPKDLGAYSGPFKDALVGLAHKSGPYKGMIPFLWHLRDASVRGVYHSHEAQSREPGSDGINITHTPKGDIPEWNKYAPRLSRTLKAREVPHRHF